MGILFDINENSLNLTTRISCAREKFHILETSFLSFFASSFFPTCHAKRFTSSRVQMDHRNASGRSKNTTMMRFAEERYHLVYDADCTLCSRFKRVVDFLDKYEKLDYVSLREAEACGLLDSIPNGRRHSSFHLVSPKGKVTSGSQAIPELVRLLPSGTIVSFLISHFPKAERILNFFTPQFQDCMILGIAAMIHTNIIQNRMVSDRRYRFSNKEKMLSLVPDRFEQLWRFPERTEEGKEGLSNHFSLGNFCKSLKDVGMISCNLTSRQIAHLVERSLSKRPLWLQISTGVFCLVDKTEIPMRSKIRLHI